MLDQFFLTDVAVLKNLIKAANLTKTDQVLEIGAGSGIVTKEIAQKAGKVLAVEIDRKFTEELKKVPGCIQLIFADALKVVKNTRKYPLKYNKIIGSLPSSIVEPLINILKKRNFELAVFLVPEKFAYKLVNNPFYNAYFKVELIKKVLKNSFRPVPRTNWEIIVLNKIIDPLEKGDIKSFVYQYFCEHPKAKLKNSLMEVIIKIFTAKGKKLTKNQARKMVTMVEADERILNSFPLNLPVFSKTIENLIRITKISSII